MHSPRRTRKSSCPASWWYIVIGLPGADPVEADAQIVEVGFALAAEFMHSRTRMSLCIQGASRALTTNQPARLWNAILESRLAQISALRLRPLGPGRTVPAGSGPGLSDNARRGRTREEATEPVGRCHSSTQAARAGAWRHPAARPLGATPQGLGGRRGPRRRGLGGGSHRLRLAAPRVERRPAASRTRRGRCPRRIRRRSSPPPGCRRRPADGARGVGDVNAHAPALAQVKRELKRAEPVRWRHRQRRRRAAGRSRRPRLRPDPGTQRPRASSRA